MPTEDQSRCKNLVLDAGPLLSLTPIRGLASTYYTTPQVLSELKDPRAREHFQRLGLLSGVKVDIRSPKPAALSHVIQFSKKTGDYSVLSHADLCVIALTYEITQEEAARTTKQQEEKAEQPTEVPESSTSDPPSHTDAHAADESSAEPSVEVPSDTAAPLDETPSHDVVKEVASETVAVEDEQDLEPLEVELVREGDEAQNTNKASRPSDASPPSSPPPRTPSPAPSDPSPESEPVFDDPSSEDDGEGEWITPSNVAYHKSRALDLLPSAPSGSATKKEEQIAAGCMTADFAMQNVLLQMGLSLVGTGGKKIERVKTWVLRCHACYKICKDNSKKFCPSCGNPSLIRASVTVTSPNASSTSEPEMKVHLKQNFQYRLRGTKYAIPAPKPGSAKSGSTGEGLVLREDQKEWSRAKKMADGRREKEEKRVKKGIFSGDADGGDWMAGVGSWKDPDWIPGIMGGPRASGNTPGGRRTDKDGMPVIGYGRKNPNERRRKA